MGVFRRFLITLSYVTSLPIRLHKKDAKSDFVQTELANDTNESTGNISREDEQNSELAGLAKYLPAAGLLIGGILAGISALLVFKLHAPSLVTGPLLAVTWLCLTGGLHFDGLMDAADGVFSHRNRERMLEIMMDSRVGNFGAMTGMAVLILKCVTLASLVAHPIMLLGVLAIAPAWARWCELYAIGRFPYAREIGKGKIWHDSTRFPGDLLIGMILPIVVTAIVASFTGLTSILAVVAFVIASGLTASHWLASHIKGHTGDTYGAVVELAETGCLILVSISIMRNT